MNVSGMSVGTSPGTSPLQSLRLAGYARNLADGRVEVLACGEAAAVDTFIAWLWEGSPAAKVTAVETVDIDPGSIQLPVDFTSA